MSGGGTAFDITPLMVPYLDTHMIIPMLDFLRDPNSVLRDEKSTQEDKVRKGGCVSHAVAAALPCIQTSYSHAMYRFLTVIWNR
jgi:hypothetical protein